MVLFIFIVPQPFFSCNSILKKAAKLCKKDNGYCKYPSVLSFKDSKRRKKAKKKFPLRHKSGADNKKEPRPHFFAVGVVLSGSVQPINNTEYTPQLFRESKLHRQ